jgi:inorganic pyrophosphatase
MPLAYCSLWPKGNVTIKRIAHEDVVIETPALNRYKYAWDPEAQRFRAKSVMPLGTSFPFDFGFVPGTTADDGDPIDVLVLADAPLAVGAIVECKLLGVVRVAQSDRGKRALIRNDRVIAVPAKSLRGARWFDLDDIGSELEHEIVEFFRTYVELQGRRFALLGRAGARAAATAIARTRNA